MKKNMKEKGILEMTHEEINDILKIPYTMDKNKTKNARNRNDFVSRV